MDELAEALLKCIQPLMRHLTFLITFYASHFMYKVIVVIWPRFILIWFEVEKNIDFYENTAVHCNTSVVLYILLLQI